MRTRFSRSKAAEPEAAPRAQAVRSAEALVANYRAIRELAGGQSMIPMVKAEAYGHGAVWAARALLGEPGLAGFGVATLAEGAALREGLGLRARRARILVFSGAAPWSEEKGAFCEHHGLTPVIAGDEDWRTFLRQGWPGRIGYELKFNTGMNRLGMSLGASRQVAGALRELPSTSHPDGILSHLAIGEDPDARLSRQQRERFAALRAELGPAAPSAQFHLANSAAIWNRKHWGLDELTDAVRPGLSLYGVPPWQGAPARGIAPVMTFKAVVLAVHRLARGESLGYGAHFKAGDDAPVTVAILGAGYADGVHRRLSGGRAPGQVHGGHAWLSGRPTRFLGLVSMDLSAVAAFPETRRGDWAELLGPRVDPWAQARAADTIPYELLTSVSARVQRMDDGQAR
jgi:alanine racemase